MSARTLIWRCIERLARDAKTLGLADDELAALFLQAATDHAIHISNPTSAAAWLRGLADALEENPREYRGADYAWTDGLPSRLSFAMPYTGDDDIPWLLRSLVSAEKIRLLLETER